MTDPEIVTKDNPATIDLQAVAAIVASAMAQTAQTQADASKSQAALTVELERIRTTRFNKLANHSLIVLFVIFGFVSGTMAACFYYGQFQMATQVLTAAFGALAGWGARSAKSQ